MHVLSSCTEGSLEHDASTEMLQAALMCTMRTFCRTCICHMCVQSRALAVLKHARGGIVLPTATHSAFGTSFAVVAANQSTQGYERLLLQYCVTAIRYAVGCSQTGIQR